MKFIFRFVLELFSIISKSRMVGFCLFCVRESEPRVRQIHRSAPDKPLLCMKSNWFLQKQQCDPQRNVYTVYFQFVYSYGRYATIQIKTKENKKNPTTYFYEFKRWLSVQNLTWQKAIYKKTEFKRNNWTIVRVINLNDIEHNFFSLTIQFLYRVFQSTGK